MGPSGRLCGFAVDGSGGRRRRAPRPPRRGAARRQLPSSRRPRQRLHAVQPRSTAPRGPPAARARRATSVERPSFRERTRRRSTRRATCRSGNHHVRVRHVRRFDRPPQLRAVVPHNAVSDPSVCAARTTAPSWTSPRQRAHDDVPRTELARARWRWCRARPASADDHSAHCVGVRLRSAPPSCPCPSSPSRARTRRRACQRRAPGRRRGARPGRARRCRSRRRRFVAISAITCRVFPRPMRVREDPAAHAAARVRRLVPDEHVLEQRLLPVVQNGGSALAFSSPPATSSPVPGAGTAAWSSCAPKRRALSFCSSQPPGANSELSLPSPAKSCDDAAARRAARAAISLVLARERLALDVRRPARRLVGPVHGASARAAPERAPVQPAAVAAAGRRSAPPAAAPWRLLELVRGAAVDTATACRTTPRSNSGASTAAWSGRCPTCSWLWLSTRIAFLSYGPSAP